jgi:putative cardiolipin synthase
MATRLDRLIGELAVGAPAGTSGVVSINVPLDAFAVRVALIRAAERSLDIQYYIWHGDTSGMMLLDEVRRAADRGVRVRMLLDDNGIPGLDDELAVLDAHPAIEVRIFNPFVHRRFKLLGLLTDFRRLNRRMHNKSLTVDDVATIVGGRNIGNAYFGGDPTLAFADLDVLAVGDVARDVGAAFDAYWESAPAHRASATIRPASAGDAGSMRKRLILMSDSALGRTLTDATTHQTVVDDVLDGRPALDWVRARVVVDPPAKIEAAVETTVPDSLVAQLARALGPAERELDLVSSYFVPGRAGAEALARFARRGVRVRIVTNSLATSDVAAVHAGYARRRAGLLRAGVRLYELRPDAGVAPTAVTRSWLPLRGSSGASLHGKTFALDRERIFVGSFNIDPRSIRLNTEMGLVIESVAMAASLSEALDRHLADVAYEVRLAADGRIEWAEHTETGEIIHRREPKAGAARRIGVRMLSWLPIEWLL